MSNIIDYPVESPELFTSRENDSDYEPSTQDTIQTESSQCLENKSLFDKDQHVIVNLECLQPLFNFCSKCGGVIEKDNIELKQNEGTLLTVKDTCMNGCDFTS